MTRSRVRVRAVRLVMAAGLLAGLLIPGSAPVAGQEEHILRAGTDQNLEVLNPWQAAVVADFEAFTLNYDLLVSWGLSLEPVAGFADRWESSADGMTHTFHIREGMTWSDGTPATSEDARWTYQLALDAVAQEITLGYGYLEVYLTNAGVETVAAPDPQTLVVTTSFPTKLVIEQAYVPILPKHIWEKYTIEQIADTTADGYFANQPPVVGTGPYQAIEWSQGEFIRFKRNESYWGHKGAAEEVILQHFETTDTMVQALKRGEIDYVRGVGPDQFNDLKDEPGIVTAEGFANGYTELAFNTKGTAAGSGAKTAVVADPAFRDALGYAIDTARLVEASLGGYGVPGDTVVPPYHIKYHVAPDRPRKFDLAEADRRLAAAGYPKDAAGKRLDKDGQPIVLRMTWPDSESENATNAQFMSGWFGELGIEVDAYVTEENTLLDDLVPPEGDGPANFDTFIWGWIGDPDPTSLLSFLTTDEIGGSSDSFWSNSRYDELFNLQSRTLDETQRKAYVAEMQNIAYDEAPYLVLYYDSELHAYRTDKFSNWKNQTPENGTPLFGYGSIGYTLLEEAAPAATPTPAVTAPPVSAGATAAPTPTPSGDAAGDSTPLIVGGVIVLLVVVGGGAYLMSKRRAAAADEEE